MKDKNIMNNLGSIWEVSFFLIVKCLLYYIFLLLIVLLVRNYFNIYLIKIYKFKILSRFIVNINEYIFLN